MTAGGFPLLQADNRLGSGIAMALFPLPSWLTELYPFSPQRFALPGDEGALSWVEAGDGPPVVFVHGNPTWSFAFRRLIQGGAEAGFRCLAADHLGCGLSDRAADAAMRFTDHSRRWLAWVDAVVGERFHLVVHDWGGPIALEAMTRQPERLLSLTILNTGAWVPPFIPARIALCRWGSFGKWLTWSMNGFAWPATWMTTVRSLARDVKRGYLYPFAHQADRRAVWEFVRDIPMEPDHPSRADLAALDARLTVLRDVKTQVQWGMRDWCFDPRVLRGWEQRLPEATVVRHANAGHYVWEDAEDLAQALVTWWRD